MKIIKAGGSSTGMRKCITFYSLRVIEIGMARVFFVIMIADGMLHFVTRSCCLTVSVCRRGDHSRLQAETRT